MTVRLLLALFLLFSTSFRYQHHTPLMSSLKFLGEYEIPYNQIFKETVIGGLSGIDYAPEQDIYYMISDDRSAIHPARFYTAKIFIGEKGIDSVRFITVSTLLQPNGQVFPNVKTDPKNTPDPEAIRYNSTAKKLVWTSEGERIIGSKGNILNDPAITVMDLYGGHIESIINPAMLTMQAIELGPRKNGTLEGLTLSPDGQTFYVSTEVPLYEDGPEADITQTNSLVRIYKFDWTSKKNIAQYAYKLEPVAYKASPETAFKINGIPEILYLDDEKLLVIERSFSTGRLPCTVKVFIADISCADNIMSNKSLKENLPAHLIEKKLLLNMDDLGIYIDNIEGVTFGPDLPNGHKTLIFLSDNNFSPLEKTQLLLFEVIP